jgi:hypothetical protein
VPLGDRAGVPLPVGHSGRHHRERARCGNELLEPDLHTQLTGQHEVELVERVDVQRRSCRARLDLADVERDVLGVPVR